MRTGKFEVYQTKDGKWRFRLKAGNGEIICSGEEYETKQGCLKGVASIQRNATKAEIEVLDREKEVLNSTGLTKRIIEEEKNPQESRTEEQVNKDERKLLVEEKPSFKWRKIPLPGQHGPNWM